MSKTDTMPPGPQGQDRLISEDEDSTGLSLSYHLYLPAVMDPTRPVLTAVHGISRNPREWMDRFRSRAQAYKAPLLTPLFSKPRYADFQRLGRYGRGERADHALIRLVDRLSAEHGFCSRMGLFGFSGGAQFAHRFAMAHPGRVASLVLGAAGWYTWPDPTTAFPYGTRSISSLPGVRFDPLQLLSLPVRVIVGERDTLRDTSLNRSRRIDTVQGRNRVERAENWVGALRAYADDNRVRCRIDYQALPGAGHGILESAHQDTFGDLVCDWLYQNLDNK